MLDGEVREKFKEFQSKTGKYGDLDIDEVRFEKKLLSDLHLKDKVITKKNTVSSKFIEIGDIDKITKKYDISKKVKHNLPLKGKFAPKGSILISRVRPLLGGYTIIDGDDYTFVSGDLNPIVLSNKIFVNYIFKIICSSKFKTFLKENQNTAGQKPTITDKLYTFDVPIPKPLNEKYTSFKLQEAIVEFLEYSFEVQNKIKERIDKRYNIFTRLRKALIPSTFHRDYVKVSFGKYAKEKGIDFSIMDVEFEIKRIHSDKKDDKDVICQKRMGFTPKTDSLGDIDWFRVEDLNATNGLLINTPNTIKKTTKDKVIAKNGKKSSKNISIQKGDILVSFLATPGIVKIYNSDNIAYCNQAIDILTVNEDIYNKYIAYNCMLEYPKYGQVQTMGLNLNDEDKKKIKIFIPKPLKNYTSLEIQKIIADFIEDMDNKIQVEIDKMDKGYKAVERLHTAYLARTFTLIDWGVK